MATPSLAHESGYTRGARYQLGDGCERIEDSDGQHGAERHEPRHPASLWTRMRVRGSSECDSLPAFEPYGFLNGRIPSIAGIPVASKWSMRSFRMAASPRLRGRLA